MFVIVYVTYCISSTLEHMFKSSIFDKLEQSVGQQLFIFTLFNSSFVWYIKSQFVTVSFNLRSLHIDPNTEMYLNKTRMWIQ